MANINIRDIFDKDGVLKDFNSNYSERPSQIEGAELIASALEENKHVLLEGGCGFGKTLCYLIPALNDMASNGFKKKVVVATSGISLQEQLFMKDIPFVVDVMKSLYPSWPSDFKYTLLKGRRNFLCNLKMDDYDLGSFSDTTLSENFGKILEFYRTTTTGDLSELDFIPTNEELKLTTCMESSDCVGRTCEKYQDCYYQKHKMNLALSNVIVTNYHMLFSDDKIGGAILPQYDVLVFDEAHEAPSIFREFMSEKITIHTFNNIRNKMSEIVNKSKAYRGMYKSSPEKLISYAEQFIQNIRTVYADKLKWSPMILESQSQLPDFENLVFTLKQVIKDMESVQEQSKSVMDSVSPDSDSDTYNTHQSIGNIASGVIETCQKIINLITDIDSIVKDENNVVWIENTNDNILIGMKQVDVGSKIRESFIDREGVTCILTSATISVGNDFNYIKGLYGMDTLPDDKIYEFIGDSPFDLTKQQLWYLPSDAVDGNNQEFQNVYCNQIKEIIVKTKGGVLCLFTSVSAMKKCKDELIRSLPGEYRVLTQGDMPRGKLLEEFRNDKNSILLGTKSFFTGVDIQGDSLRCVVIDKFPFPTPSDPVQQKLKEKNNSFYRFSIPEMVISLKQAVGRGVRSINDKAVIAILDGRMATARYKARVATSFNYKKTATRDLNDIDKFLS